MNNKFMSKKELISFIENKIRDFPMLINEGDYTPKFQLWNSTTEKVLKENLESDVAKFFSGILVVSSYYHFRGAPNPYHNHLKKKKQALEAILAYVQSDDFKDKMVFPSEIEEQEDGSQTAKKRTRKTSIGFNTGVFKGLIEEEREL